MTRPARFAAFLLVSAGAACGAFSGQGDSSPVTATDASTEASIVADGNGAGDAASEPDAGSVLDEAGASNDAGEVDSATGVVVFADYFESGNCAAWTGGASVSLDAITDGGAHGGAGFCRVCVTANGGSTSTMSLPAAPGNYTLMAWLRVTSSPSTNTELGNLELNVYDAKNNLLGLPTSNTQKLQTTWQLFSLMSAIVPDGGADHLQVEAFRTNATPVTSDGCFDMDDVTLVRQ